MTLLAHGAAVDGGRAAPARSPSEGAKENKPQAMALLPWGALLRVSEVYEFGARKYAPQNWRKGIAYSALFSALQRHLAAWWEGEEVDPESGLSHLTHAAFHVLALLTYATDPDHYGGHDDRPVAP